MGVHNKNGRDGRDFPVAFTNLENMDRPGTLEELHAEASNSKRPPLVIGAAETWERIEKDHNYILPGYVWVGKPRQRDRGGVGFWVSRRITHRVTTVTVKDDNEAILWIKVIGDVNVLYIAVVYSRPNQLKEHAKLLKTLHKNVSVLSKLGDVLVMGDFNSKRDECTYSTTNNDPKTLSHGVATYERLLAKFVVDSYLLKLINKNINQIENDTNHTNYTKESGTVIDYILTNKLHDRGNYKVHREVSLQSSHRYLTYTCTFVPPTAQWCWGKEYNRKTDWEKASVKAQYKQYTAMTKTEYEIMMSTEPSNKSIVLLSYFVTSKQQHATDKVAQPKRQPKEQKIAQKYMYGKGKKISALLQKKKFYLKMTYKQQGQKKKETWGKIHSIVQEIRTLIDAEKLVVNLEWWQLCEDKLNPMDARSFFKLIKKLKTDNNNPFPQIMKDRKGHLLLTKV